MIGGIALLAAPIVLFRAITSGLGDDEFDFRPIPSAPGFRSLSGGAVSATGNPFIGLDVPGAEPAPEPIGMAALCGVLFGEERTSDGTVPVAYFTDYNCPYCGRLSARLREREAEGLRISWHELPLLGESSEAAARAALAAGRQGGYADFHARLMRASFQPTEAYVAELASGLGLDPERLLSDMNSAGVARELTDTRRVAARLGIGATPTLVVGRTVVTGLISEERLEALLRREAEDGPLPC